jgi:poly(A) polymerase
MEFDKREDLSIWCSKYLEKREHEINEMSNTCSKNAGKKEHENHILSIWCSKYFRKKEHENDEMLIPCSKYFRKIEHENDEMLNWCWEMLGNCEHEIDIRWILCWENLWSEMLDRGDECLTNEGLGLLAWSMSIDSPVQLRAEATRLLRVLRQGGYAAYFAGGCVRDFLLGREPKDYDIATNATPTEVVALFPHAQQVGAHFGVVVVRSKGAHFEVATFRTDGSYKDGRRPESVSFSTPEEDAQRRDFTINGLFYDPISEEVIDYVGGEADLRAGVLRAIGDAGARFQEDYLRLLRAVRFAASLGFEIEAGTWASICTHAGGLGRISVERIQQEFVRMMVHASRVRGFDLLVESGLMAVFFPEILALQGCEQPPQWHPEGDVFVHTRLMLSMVAPDAPLALVLAILLHDIGKPATAGVDETGRIRFSGHDAVGAVMAEEILRRMKFPNDTIEQVVEMVACHMRYMNVKEMRTAKLKRFMARSTFTQELELHRIDCASSNGFTENYDFLQGKIAEFSQAPMIPARVLDGRDLMLLGFPSGPLLGEILTGVQTQQLEGVLRTKEEALAWVRVEYQSAVSNSEDGLDKV